TARRHDPPRGWRRSPELIKPFGHIAAKKAFTHVCSEALQELVEIGAVRSARHHLPQETIELHIAGDAPVRDVVVNESRGRFYAVRQRCGTEGLRLEAI